MTLFYRALSLLFGSVAVAALGIGFSSMSLAQTQAGCNCPFQGSPCKPQGTICTGTIDCTRCICNGFPIAVCS